MALVTAIPQANAYRYRAFVSYAHSDQKWANWLVDALESFRVPRRLVGRETPVGPIPRSLGPLFFDRDELGTVADLTASIRRALSESAFLIVICSPAAAASRWVNEEVRFFKESGRAERVLAVIVDGEPGDPHQECLPPALKEDHALAALHDPTRFAEPAAADLRPNGDGNRRAIMRLAAGLTGISYGELVRREWHRRHRRMAWLAAASLAGMSVTLVLTVSAYVARQDAQRSRDQAEDLVSFMVGDLRQRLEPVGRLDVLDAVGDKAMAYFSALKPRDVNDGTLANRARVLTQIGEIRLRQGRSDEALSAFREAHRVARELTDRRPGDGARLFDRGQAEFWIGFVHLERNELGAAETWLTRYQDTSARLVARDPANAQWQRELAYALHNVGVVRLRAARPVEAAAAFSTARERLEALVATEPPDPDLDFAVADEIAWQALVAERSSRPARALELYREHHERLESLVERYPRDKTWRQPAANANQHLGRVFLQLGDLDSALAAYKSALSGLVALTDHDPKNLEWQRDLVTCHRGLAEVHLAAGRDSQAFEHAHEAVRTAEAIVSEDPANADWLTTLSGAEGALALTRLGGGGEPPDLLELESNVALAERLLGESPDDPELQRTAATAWLALGYGLHDRGEAGQAAMAFDRVIEAGQGRENDPVLGLLAVRALGAAGHRQRADSLAQGMVEAGYRHPVLVALCNRC